MTSRFVEVPASAIRERLAGAGFRLLPATVGEEVYERAHDKDARYTLKVYSSIQRGAESVRVVAVREVIDTLVDSALEMPATIELCVFTGKLGAALDILGVLEQAGVPIHEPNEEPHPLS